MPHKPQCFFCILLSMACFVSCNNSNIKLIDNNTVQIINTDPKSEDNNINNNNIDIVENNADVVEDKTENNAEYIDISDKCRPDAGEQISINAWAEANNTFAIKFLKKRKEISYLHRIPSKEQ